MSELKTVEHVDVKRYMGIWYELARIPHRFERGLVGVTAEYSLLEDGKVRVVNRGRKGGLDGMERRAQGVAEVVDPETNAKLKVSFFWPFKGNYWIIELGSDYEYAVVGDESREYLWILSRTPQMEAGVYDELLRRAREKGFDVSRLEKVPQGEVKRA